MGLLSVHLVVVWKEQEGWIGTPLVSAEKPHFRLLDAFLAVSLLRGMVCSKVMWKGRNMHQ